MSLSPYYVGTAPDGLRHWWEGWRFNHVAPSNYTEVRSATPDEASLMDDIVSHNKSDDASDLKKLIERRAP